MEPAEVQPDRLQSRVRRRTAVAERSQRALESSDAAVAVGSRPAASSDSGRLRRAVRNPPDGAITHARDDTPRISVFADKCGREWTISVRDRGIGIVPADAGRVFRPSDRLRGGEEYDCAETTSRSVGGSPNAAASGRTARGRAR